MSEDKITYKESVIECFVKLDIERLNGILKEEYSYQDTTKEIFLKEIEQIFNANKNSGDTELLIFKGQCQGEECINCSKGGYRFIGNVSKNYFDLLFIEENNDITDIFDCSSFKPDKECGELNGKAWIHINSDDKVSFQRTPSYEIKLNAALTAMDEIILDDFRAVETEEVKYWLEKHKYAYERIGSWDVFQATMKWTPFIKLYGELQIAVDFLERNGVELSNWYYTKPNESNEAAMIEWVLNSEAFNKLIPYELRYADFLKPIFSRTKSKVRLTIKDSLYDLLYAFSEFWDRNNEILLEKFGTYTQEEIMEIYSDELYQNETDHIYSLRFHLNKRKESADMGIVIQLYLSKQEDESIGDGKIN